MKKITSLLAALLVAAMPFVMTSCDDDDYWYDDDPWWYGYDDGGWGWSNDYWNNGGYDESTYLAEAQALAGEWEGMMKYTTAGTNGASASEDVFNVNMTFVQNSVNSLKGTGTEIDYLLDDNNSVTDQQTLKFNWYIDANKGDIYIKYTSGSTFVMDYNAGVHGFTLDTTKNPNIFDGYMIGTNNNDMAYFEMDRVTNNEAKANILFGGVEAQKSVVAQQFGSKSIEKMTMTGSKSLPLKR